ncbi:unnamed protein product [Cylicocyclus nassatus]|uniref:Uncharacterized protein n=1 Tax=Cylicocyclus nassatus TaxID=53992 RepID=A0AA36GTF0_CYLNA|nr:unnamed protein product [Cylicocyclus nassatus]
MYEDNFLVDENELTNQTWSLHRYLLRGNTLPYRSPSRPSSEISWKHRQHALQAFAKGHRLQNRPVNWGTIDYGDLNVHSSAKASRSRKGDCVADLTSDFFTHS